MRTIAMEQPQDEQPGIEITGPAQIKSFLTFLAEQGQGAVASELSEGLRELTEAMAEHFDKFRGKVKGELKVKIKFVLEKGIFTIDTDYEVKRPAAPTNRTPMWLGNDGNLQTENPKQLRMPFTGLPGGKAHA